jgi:hypothetical protein
VKIVLTASSREIAANRAGVAVISADIVDRAGVHVYGANPPLSWKVSGPGALAGPAVYQTDTNKNGAMEGTMYIDAPVANVVRAQALPGKILVSVSAPGLESSEIAVAAVAPPNDAVDGITEPRLDDAGRIAVTRDPNFKTVAVAPKSKAPKLAEIRQDYELPAKSRAEYREKLSRFIEEHNPEISISTSKKAYQQMLDGLTDLLEQRNGHLVADDYNFAVRKYNEGKK